jgi:hypothetical protein
MWLIKLPKFYNTEWSKLSVHLMITIQKVTSNLQSVPSQSPDIYWHAELCSWRRLLLSLIITVSDWNSLKYVCVFLYCNHHMHRDFWSPCLKFAFQMSVFTNIFQIALRMQPYFQPLSNIICWEIFLFSIEHVTIKMISHSL